PTTLTEKMPITAMPRTRSSERMRSAATVAIRSSQSVSDPGGAAPPVRPGLDFHPIPEEAFMRLAQFGDADPEQAVAANGAEPADAAIFVAFSEVSLECRVVRHSHQMASLIFPEPPLSGRVVGMPVNFGTEAAAQRHFCERHGNTAIRHVMDRSHQPARD